MSEKRRKSQGEHERSENEDDSERAKGGKNVAQAQREIGKTGVSGARQAAAVED